MEKFSNNNFQAEISSGTVVVDFYADWCRPCAMLKPTFAKVADSMPEVKFGTVDIEECSDIAAKLKISSLPTILVFQNGQIVEKISGLTTEKILTETIQKHL